MACGLSSALASSAHTTNAIVGYYESFRKSRCSSWGKPPNTGPGAPYGGVVTCAPSGPPPHDGPGTLAEDPNLRPRAPSPPRSARRPTVVPSLSLAHPPVRSRPRTGTDGPDRTRGRARARAGHRDPGGHRDHHHGVGPQVLRAAPRDRAGEAGPWGPGARALHGLARGRPADPLVAPHRPADRGRDRPAEDQGSERGPAADRAGWAHQADDPARARLRRQGTRQAHPAELDADLRGRVDRDHRAGPGLPAARRASLRDAGLRRADAVDRECRRTHARAEGPGVGRVHLLGRAR